MKLPTWLIDAFESDKSKWNKGICKKSGQPWYWVRSWGFRGRMYNLYDVFEDGCGNTLYLQAPSDCYTEYQRLRTPAIAAKERAARERIASKATERGKQNGKITQYDEDGKEIPFVPPPPPAPSKGEIIVTRLYWVFGAIGILYWLLRFAGWIKP